MQFNCPGFYILSYHLLVASHKDKWDKFKKNKGSFSFLSSCSFCWGKTADSTEKLMQGAKVLTENRHWGFCGFEITCITVIQANRKED